ncbi:hypothetical protein EDEG_00691 [Edhazardia aedis USNM 41457]|uniref:NOG C-terminal domain-containing protein n=1 Tax=Edhazardia aedis (strain USNM 41457) TaxID=1003232 RepID=J9DBX4_EDHAE|nr:hypothetical protein EDEG_00691 [Edhazardia aedis USNM 41457]|eukprot:EJW05226.1 hypothetical protein EDEG_00691 [Edhazardia aedis USNM 41457]
MLISFLIEREFVFMSTENNINVDEVKKIACKKILHKRLEKKLNSTQIDSIKSRIQIVKPSVIHKQEESLFRSDIVELESHKFEKDRKNYFFDDCEKYVCENKYDIIPEIYNGKNIYDFIDTNAAEMFEKIENDENSKNTLRTYDIFTKEERKYIETIGKRKREKEILSSFNNRATIPIRWIDNRVKNVVEDVLPPKPATITHEKPPKIDNEFKKPLRYFEKRPKHIFRARSKKGLRRK